MKQRCFLLQGSACERHAAEITMSYYYGALSVPQTSTICSVSNSSQHSGISLQRDINKQVCHNSTEAPDVMAQRIAISTRRTSFVTQAGLNPVQTVCMEEMSPRIDRFRQCKRVDLTISGPISNRLQCEIPVYATRHREPHQ